MVTAGLDFSELHMHCHRKIAILLAEIGVATGSADALVEAGVTSAFYPHGLGHLLGIQVHDVGGHQLLLQLSALINCNRSWWRW